MKYIALVLITVLTGTISHSQITYDLGIKTSTFERDRTQIEQRFHFKSDYFLTANFSMGSQFDGYSTSEETSGNIITDTDILNQKNQFYSGRIGIAKKLSSLPNNFFYVGTSIGMGYEQYASSREQRLSYFDENGEFIHLPTGMKMSEDVTRSSSFKSGPFYQLYFTFGMDVPLTKRLLVNCEFNASILHSKNATSLSSGLSFVPSFSGGLRYSFGAQVD